MQNYAVARGSIKGPRREGPYDEGFVSHSATLCTQSLIRQLPPLLPHVQKSLDSSEPQAGLTAPPAMNETSSTPSGTLPYVWSAGPSPLNGEARPQLDAPEQFAIPGIPAASGHTFGVDLFSQLERDGLEVPRVLQKCTEAIEAYGMCSRASCRNLADESGIENTGIYRLSGTTSRVQALKHALDSGKLVTAGPLESKSLTKQISSAQMSCRQNGVAISTSYLEY